MSNNNIQAETIHKKILDKMSGELRPIFIGVANALALKAYQSGDMGKRAFTGNTWTGTAVGAYYRGSLYYSITTRQISDMPKPVFHKLRNDKSMFLKQTYGFLYGDSDVESRWIRPTIDTSHGYSEEDALNFLKNYKAKSIFDIVVMNGSEYASYLQNTRGLDVILSAYNYAKSIKIAKI